jgi:hypothetical protein
LLTKERWMDAAYANSTETAKKWNVRFGFGWEHWRRCTFCYQRAFWGRCELRACGHSAVIPTVVWPWNPSIPKPHQRRPPVTFSSNKISSLRHGTPIANKPFARLVGRQTCRYPAMLLMRLIHLFFSLVSSCNQVSQPIRHTLHCCPMYCRERHW